MVAGRSTVDDVLLSGVKTEPRALLPWVVAEPCDPRPVGVAAGLVAGCRRCVTRALSNTVCCCAGAAGAAGKPPADGAAAAAAALGLCVLSAATLLLEVARMAAAPPALVFVLPPLALPAGLATAWRAFTPGMNPPRWPSVVSLCSTLVAALGRSSLLVPGPAPRPAGPGSESGWVVAVSLRCSSAMAAGLVVMTRRRTPAELSACNASATACTVLACCCQPCISKAGRLVHRPLSCSAHQMGVGVTRCSHPQQAPRTLRQRHSSARHCMACVQHCQCGHDDGYCLVRAHAMLQDEASSQRSKGALHSGKPHPTH